MTHLKIEQNSGIIEEVSSDVIKKLYDVVHGGNLDLTSNLIGRLHTTATYQDYIDYLEDTFKVDNVKLLIIDATKKYLMFEDPEVLRITLSHNIGDSTGVSASDLTSVTNIDTWFRNNTTITSLNDLLKFTNVISILNIATNDTNLISVTLGEGLLEIKDSCFYGCSSLLTINFPSTLTKINDNRQYNNYGAFTGCTSLTTITGGENIIVLGPAFSNCSSLLSLGDIDLSNLIHLGGSCFANCENLELGSVTLSNSITTMGDRVFAECKKLTSINIPGVTTITPSNNFAQGSFYDCDHLTTVTGSNIAYIGQMSFRYCSTLSSIDLSNCTYIGLCAFLDCTSLTSIDLSSCTTIGTSAFQGCASLTTVSNLNSNLTTISNKSFCDCSALTTIDLSGVTTIQESAFLNCTSLTSIDLSNITTFGINAFYNSGISGIIDLSNCTTSNIFNEGANVFTKCPNITLIINVPSNVTTIGDVNVSNEGPLYGCTNLTVFDASNSGITTVKSRAFSKCPSISIIKLPSTVTSIAAIFSHCTYTNTIKIYLPCSTPPTLTESWNTNRLNYQSSVFSGGIEVYVPDANISDYLNDADWGILTIKAISTWSE